MKILIVDDDHATLQLFATILKADQIYTSTSGEEAICLARKNKFDMILMDVSMPGIGGIEATKIIMKEKLIEYPSRIWAISTHHEDTVVDAALDAGMKDYLTKPIRPKFLLSRLKTIRESIELYNENAKERRKWQTMFDLLPDPAALTDPQTGKYLEVNQAFLDEIQMSRAEVIGETPVSLGIMSGAERERFTRALNKTEHIKNMPIVYRYRNGEQFFGTISARLIRNGTDKILSVTRNETEARLLRQKTQEQAERLQRFEQVAATLQEVSAATEQVLSWLQEPKGG